MTFEEALIEHCSPTLAGVKPASLFRFCPRDSALFARRFLALRQQFAARGLRLVILKGCRRTGSYLLYLYRERDLAEELTQETFLRAIRSIDTYRGEGELRVWLCSIAKNLFYSQMKKQKRSIPVADEDFPEGESQEKTLIDRIADRETAMEIYQALHRLRDPYKEVFSLRVFGELSFREIGGLFEKSEHWACVTYHT